MHLYVSALGFVSFDIRIDGSGIFISYWNMYVILESIRSCLEHYRDLTVNVETVTKKEGAV